MRSLNLVCLILVFGVGGNLFFASICEPRSLWLVRDILGVGIGKECR